MIGPLLAPGCQDRHLGAVDALHGLAQIDGPLRAGVILRTAALELGQTGQPRFRLGGIAPVLRSGHRHLSGGQFVDDPGKAFGGQILVIILADLRHGRICAGPQTFHLFPRELAIRRELKGLRRDLVLANRNQVLGPADHA